MQNIKMPKLQSKSSQTFLSAISSENAETKSQFIKVCILGASFTTGNLGVSALLHGTLTALFHSYPNARVTIFDYGLKSKTFETRINCKSYYLDFVNIRFSKNIFKKNNIARLIFESFILKYLPSNKISHTIISNNPFIRCLYDSDIIFALSGGDSFSDIYGLERFFYVSLPQILALNMNRRLLLLPQTIGPLKRPIAKIFSRFILGNAKKIYVREKDSLSEISRMPIKLLSPPEFCYDVGFILEPRISDRRKPKIISKKCRDKPLIGMNFSGLLYIGGYTKKNMFGLKDDYRLLMHSIIELFIKKYNADILLLPHVIGGGENAENDIAGCKSLFNESKSEFKSKLHLMDQGYDQHEIKAIIGQCDFAIGSRMHACIAALSQGVPAIGLAYSQKFRGVFSSIGMEKLVVDLRNTENPNTIQLIERAYNQRTIYRNQLNLLMPEVRTTIFNLFKKL